MILLCVIWFSVCFCFFFRWFAWFLFVVLFVDLFVSLLAFLHTLSIILNNEVEVCVEITLMDEHLVSLSNSFALI